MKQEEIEKLFTHPAPTPDQIASIGTIEAYASALATCVVMYVPLGSDQAAAIRKIREAVMTATAGILLAESKDQIVEIEANAFIDFFKMFAGLFRGLLPKDADTKITIGITSFIKTDLGQLAIDAVEYVQANMPGATGIERRDAAVAKLKTDAATAGKDLSAFAKSTIIWFVETALQALVAKGLAAAAELAVHA